MFQALWARCSNSANLILLLGHHSVTREIARHCAFVSSFLFFFFLFSFMDMFEMIVVSFIDLQTFARFGTFWNSHRHVDDRLLWLRRDESGNVYKTYVEAWFYLSRVQVLSNFIESIWKFVLFFVNTGYLPTEYQGFINTIV